MSLVAAGDSRPGGRYRVQLPALSPCLRDLFEDCGAALIRLGHANREAPQVAPLPLAVTCGEGLASSRGDSDADAGACGARLSGGGRS